MEKESLEWRWCLVGNIVDKRIYGEKHEIQYGIKIFSPGTKVYIAPHQWGDGGENLVVIGNPKGKKGLVECIINRKYIHNFRIKKIYSSSEILRKINESKYDWWGNDDEWRNCIIEYAEQANKNNESNNKIIIENKDSLLSNIEKLHTTELGNKRIKNNLNLEQEDVVNFCKTIILNKNCNIYREGKNWYCELDNIRITINVFSYTIITAHINNC